MRIAWEPTGRLTPIWAWLIVCAIISVSPPLPAQEAAPGEVASGDLESSRQAVDVEAPAADDRIAERLERIMASTGRFSSIQVDVRDGVVFLDGATRQEAYKEWATELARKTQDVAAVINNIEVEDGPIWTLAPARREMQSLWREVIHSLPLILIGLVVLGVTLLVAGTLSRVIVRLFGATGESDLLRSVVRRAVYLVIVLIGFYFFLRISGLTRIAIAMISGTGLIGLILGFAFRDIAENFLASILISMQRPFRLGDVIEVNGQQGVVQKVTTRGTLMMDFDGNHIQIANSTVYKNTIKNYTANPKMRINFPVGIGYDSSIIKAQEIAMGVLREHSAVLDDPEPMVLVESLASSTIVIRVYFWIDAIQTSSLKVQSSVMRLVVRAFEQGAISLPDDAREIIFPQGVPIQTDAEVARARPKPVARADAEQERTAAEGDLSSDVEEIERQARESRSPEEGHDILKDDSARRDAASTAG